MFSQLPKKWPDEVKNIFMKYYDSHGPKIVSEKMRDVGFSRSPSTLKDVVRRIGKLSFCPATGFNLNEAARLLGIKYTTLYNWVRRNHSDELKARGRWQLISFEFFEFLQKKFPKIPEGYILLGEAARILGYSSSTLTKKAHLGHLKSIKHGRWIYVDSSQIEKIRQYFSNNPDRVKMDWRVILGNKPGWITLDEASKITGIDKFYLTQRTWEGLLPSYKQGSWIYVDEAKVRHVKQFKMKYRKYYPWDIYRICPDGFVPAFEASQISGKSQAILKERFDRGYLSRQEVGQYVFYKKEEMLTIRSSPKNSRGNTDWENIFKTEQVKHEGLN